MKKYFEDSEMIDSVFNETIRKDPKSYKGIVGGTSAGKIIFNLIDRAKHLHHDEKVKQLTEVLKALKVSNEDIKKYVDALFREEGA